MGSIRQIIRKELDRVLKDRKMIFSVFILPVVLMIGILTLVTNLSHNMQQNIDNHQSIIYVQNAPDGFEDYLKKVDSNITLHDVTDMSKAKDMILHGDADLIIEFPDNFLADIQAYQPGAAIPQIKTYYNPSEDFSSAAFNHVSVAALESYRQSLLAQRIGDMSELEVFTVNSDNPNMIIQDSARATGRMLGSILPYLVTLLLFAGAMGIGTDMVAGEKERGTMASLLVSPVKRSSIVLGKVFALMCISGISSIIYVGAMVVFMPHMMGGANGGADLGLDLSFTPQQIFMLALLLVAIAFLYATIIVLVSVFAKTVREASTLIMPAYILVLVLGMLTIFSNITPHEWSYLIPVYSATLALQGILTQDVTWVQYGMTLGVTLALGVVLIGAIVKAFESEKVMSI